MNKRASTLFAVLVVMVVGTPAFAGLWEDKVVKQISSYWPKGECGTGADNRVAPTEFRPMQNWDYCRHDSYVGLVPIEWKWTHHGQVIRRNATATVQVRAKVAVAQSPHGTWPGISHR
jgi:hypothetical protein